MHRWTKTEVAAVGETLPALRGALADDPDPLPQSREEYFRRYLDRFHGGRVLRLFQQVVPKIGPEDDVLSLASGRCALELALAQRTGCRIECSDQKAPPWLEAVRRELFPELRFREIDVLSADAEPLRGRSVVLALGLAYLFDLGELARLFSFAWQALLPGGRFVVNTTHDTCAARFLHDVLVPAEAPFVAAAKSLAQGKRYAVRRSAHGYHHKAKEMRDLASDSLFLIEDIWTGAYGADVGRSRLLSLLGERALSVLGRLAPFEQIYTLRKLHWKSDG